ncbi:hypothetical protein D1007_58228 [Hordeum vulgare]|nr:hypothetical protein D1007_58228 [Hordeum vulgare]
MENMDEEGKDKHAENMQIEGMITKDEDVNPESSKTIEQQAIMDDTENIHINELLIKEESSGINDKDEVEKKNCTQATDCEVTQACFLFKELTRKGTSEQMQPTQDNELAQMFDTEGGETIGDNLADSNVRADKDEEEKKKSTQSTHSEELTFKETSEQMHQVQDEELEQTWGTEGAETIGDKLADSNGIAGKDELEENKSTQSTDSGLSEVTEELTDNETSKQMEACGDEELEQTSGREGAEIIGDKLPMPAQTWKPIRLHNKPKKAQDYVVAREGTDKSFYALVLLHLFSSLLINVITSIMIDYACTGDDWSVIENIMSEPNDKRTLVSIDDSNLQRRQLERLLFPGEFLGEK